MIFHSNVFFLMKIGCVLCLLVVVMNPVVAFIQQQQQQIHSFAGISTKKKKTTSFTFPRRSSVNVEHPFNKNSFYYVVQSSGIGTTRKKKHEASSDQTTKTSKKNQRTMVELSKNNKRFGQNKLFRNGFAIFLSLQMVFGPPTPPQVAIPTQTPTPFFLTTFSAAWAAGYGSFTDEQKAIAEAWRLVDNSYLDRTFNNQDWFQLRETYVKKKYKTMDDARTAITDMVSTLGDKYTRYLPPGKYQSIVDSATGTLAGVGVEISTDKDGRIYASDIEENSPALISGIQAGDIFVEVDGTRFDVGQPTPDDVALKLRGPKGSKVGVVMSRNDKQYDVIVTREPITITSVKSYVSTATDNNGGKLGVIRIKSFSGTTATTVSNQYKELVKKGVKTILFDVRGNPGGLLPGGVDTASLFLDANQPVVFVVNKSGIADSQYTFTSGLDLSTPLLILVDSNTASAAEVFTAALKENKRAVVIGEQTFGKGIVQTIRGLSDNNGGIAITVARYETPNHNDINKSGIPVDIKTSVDCSKTDVSACMKGLRY